MQTREERVEIVNQIIKEISSRGRRFFYCERFDRVSHIKIKHKRLYFVDDYSGKDIYLHRPDGYPLKGFTHGGTLRGLVNDMKEYIMTGEYTNHNNGYGGLYCHHWGYPQEDMTAIQQKAIDLGYLIEGRIP